MINLAETFEMKDSIKARLYFLDGMVQLATAPMSKGEVPSVWDVHMEGRGWVRFEYQGLKEGKDIAVYCELPFIL